jgi:hypothetical protein
MNEKESLKRQEKNKPPPYICPSTQAKRDIKRNKNINRKGLAPLL